MAGHQKKNTRFAQDMRITIIGSGKVGSALACALNDAGHIINEICGRNKKTVAALSKKVKAKAVYAIKNISPESDIYIICVNDSYITEVAASIPFTNKPVVHTSGATPSNVLERFNQFGIFYPVNSVSEATFSFNETPFCISSNNSRVTAKLKSLVKDLKGKSYVITDNQRLSVHLAAVFANNFSNALYQAAHDLIEQEQVPFEILKPIILATAEKITDHLPARVQTGPAMRGDNVTMQKHLQLLKGKPQLKKIYQLLSDLIRTQH